MKYIEHLIPILENIYVPYIYYQVVKSTTRLLCNVFAAHTKDSSKIFNAIRKGVRHTSCEETDGLKAESHTIMKAMRPD